MEVLSSVLRNVLSNSGRFGLSGWSVWKILMRVSSHDNIPRQTCCNLVPSYWPCLSQVHIWRIMLRYFGSLLITSLPISVLNRNLTLDTKFTWGWDTVWLSMTLLAAAPLVQAETSIGTHKFMRSKQLQMQNTESTSTCVIEKKRKSWQVWVINLTWTYLRIFDADKILVTGFHGQIWIPKHCICPSAKREKFWRES